MRISQQTFQKLDVNGDRQLSLAELQKADQRKDNFITAAEAEHAGIAPQDIKAVNATLTYFEGMSPSEIAFPSPQASRDPASFTSTELSQLNKKYGIYPSQPARNQFFAGLADMSPLGQVSALDAVSKNHLVIDRMAAQYHVPPLLLASVLYDEVLHSKPLEEQISAGKERTTNKPASFGLTQVGTPELLRHGHLNKGRDHRRGNSGQ